MTYFLNFRIQPVGGGVNDPSLWEGDGTTQQWKRIDEANIPSKFLGKNILFATHGFNVNQASGARALGLLDKYLNLTAPDLFVAMLWPGDSFIPIVDYPFEGNVAIDAGNRLAKFCMASCAAAQSLSFFSHSLGARFVLQAVANLSGRKARSVCMAAAAINRDCLTAEYTAAAQNSERISLLASEEDDVLKIAFAIGDPFADLLHDDHTPFQAALGSDGPPLPPPPAVKYPWQIPNEADYGHFSYLPPTPPNRPKQWPRAADFLKRAFLDQPQTWPPT